MTAKWPAALILLGGLAVPPAFAQDVFTFDSRALRAGDTFIFVSDQGKTVQLTHMGPGLYEKPDGSIMRRDADGNALQNGDTTFEPHSGIRPPGSGGELVVGDSWTHTYTQAGIGRTRKCKIEKREDLSIKAGLFPGAYRVTCVNQRSGRSLPKYEEIWFAPGLDFEIKFIAKWGGSSPGTFWCEVTEVRLAE